MAGDWIKMRSELQSHPKIVRILSATKSDKFRVIGGLHAVWAVFDAHSTTGALFGYTPELMDHVIGWPGFSDAMIGVKWLVFDGAETLSLPEFDEHNSQGAKRRAEDQKRKRNTRLAEENIPHQTGQISANESDKSRTKSGPDKRREDSKNTLEQQAARPSAKSVEGFDAFYAAYPRKVGGEAARKAFAKIKPDPELLDVMLKALACQARSEQWRDQKFIPYPATWLNGKRWQDSIEPARGAGRSDDQIPDYLRGAI